MPRDDRTTTGAKAELHDVTMPLLTAMYSEFKELSKRRPNDAVSVAKILDKEASVEYLDLLDEDNVPLNSDVVLMLSQFVAAMKQFRSTYTSLIGIKQDWTIPHRR